MFRLNPAFPPYAPSMERGPLRPLNTLRNSLAAPVNCFGAVHFGVPAQSDSSAAMISFCFSRLSPMPMLVASLLSSAGPALPPASSPSAFRFALAPACTGPVRSSDWVCSAAPRSCT